MSLVEVCATCLTCGSLKGILDFHWVKNLDLMLSTQFLYQQNGTL